MQRRPCCSVVTGTSIFATVNCVVTGLACLVTLANKWGLTVLALCFITFAFSVTLVRGVVLKKPPLIKAYVFFGVLVLVVCMLSNVILIALSKVDFGKISTQIDVNKLMFTIGLAALIICIIYSAILAMIWSTYKQMSKEIIYDHLFND